MEEIRKMSVQDERIDLVFDYLTQFIIKDETEMERRKIGFKKVNNKVNKRILSFLRFNSFVPHRFALNLNHMKYFIPVLLAYTISELFAQAIAAKIKRKK